MITAISLIKKGQVVLLKGMGTDGEEELRTLSQHESFGLDDESLLEMENEVQRHSSTQLGHALLRQTAKVSARATTYCDVVELRMAELVRLLEQDWHARQLLEGRSNHGGSALAPNSQWRELRAAAIIRTRDDGQGDDGVDGAAGGHAAAAAPPPSPPPSDVPQRWLVTRPARGLEASAVAGGDKVSFGGELLAPGDAAGDGRASAVLPPPSETLWQLGGVAMQPAADRQGHVYKKDGSVRGDGAGSNGRETFIEEALLGRQASTEGPPSRMRSKADTNNRDALRARHPDALCA